MVPNWPGPNAWPATMYTELPELAMADIKAPAIAISRMRVFMARIIPDLEIYLVIWRPAMHPASFRSQISSHSTS
jgi:hypothetical protein